MTFEERDPSFEKLLAYLKTHRGFDFTSYKRPSLMRRVQRRMQTIGLEEFGDYEDYLEVHPEEYVYLFNTILINVTSFFRDMEAWQYLAEHILPGIVNVEGNEDSIRIWSAGTASGEEAYTLAMLMAEAMGLEQAQQRLKIYATDVDEEDLTRARLGGYTPKEVEAVPEELRDKYFELNGGRYLFNNGLRRAVIFGRHDLVQDAPISRLDLLVCRNTLIYFNSEAQRHILARFHFALRDEGYLFLGKAEMLLTHAHLFSHVCLQHRIFQKVTQATPRDEMVMLARAGTGAVEDLSNYARLREAALDASPMAQVLVDRAGRTVLANEKARSLFGIDPQDVGRRLQDLELSYRPVELRSMIERAQMEDREVLKRNARRPLPDGSEQLLDVRVRPFHDTGRRLLGAAISFEDVTERHRLQNETETTKHELEMAQEELQSTNEELETTNEELHSMVEELQTTNEQLQSANEEMEAMNEELHSTNEELWEMNSELRRRTLEAQRAGAFLESILSSVDVGVVVLDRDMEVLLWNERAEDLWGLRSEEVQGRSFLELDIGLPVTALEESVRAVLDEEEGVHEAHKSTVEAWNRRGRRIQLQVTQMVRFASDGRVAGVVLLMEEP
jgi:two-component system, chemotaxis family, CheB/CheR fusion protein